MKVVIVGASGNIGSALIRELAGSGDQARHEIVGVARRIPEVTMQAQELASVRWESADVATTDLDPIFEGADVIVHLAWLFQPSHDPDLTWQTNAVGTRRLFDAAARQGVSAVIVNSSIAAYSPSDGPPVDESWPTDGPSSASYAREKVYVERLLDIFELEHPDIRVVRFRPAFVFQRSAASSQRRLFAGPLLPGRLLDPKLIPILPVPHGLRMQTVHAGDLARALAAAVERPVSGAFNIAADDVLDRDALAEVFSAKTLGIPPGLARHALGAAWRLHLVPAPGNLFDALMRLPVMSADRAKAELDWEPQHSGREALEAFLEGVRHGAGSTMPPLDPHAGGRFRLKEFKTGIGSKP
jgi:nucleoside-diphosphate-sugar epimerase